jgi:single-stranded-DNA-specific exonuclease
MSEKRWTYNAQPDEEVVNNLCTEINVNPVLSSILVQRGITNFDEAKRFFRPSLEHLHDPFLMKDMDKAVSRLESAFKNKEKLLIYGDYDVDGTTAVALVFDFLKKIYPDIDYYIPDRYKEGYGISQEGIAYAHANGIKLIIALDCGIKSVNLVGQAKEYGIDFIICDHHLPGSELPPAVAVLDPKQFDCCYPFKELSGCGIGFKLMQAYSIKNNLDLQHLYSYLDLVVVSIASDIVPIVGENRTLAYCGLQVLNSSPRPGLKALTRVSGLSAVDINGVVFGIGPRINASGRIGHAKNSVELLLADKEDELLELAHHVNHNNDVRKNVDSTITSEALEMIATDPFYTNAKSTVLFKQGWHKGVIGIVASRCIEKYYRPTIIFTEYNNKATGSARSVYGFNIYDAIAECADLLEQFGGHKYAAGLTMDVNNVAAFQQKFEEVVSKTILEEHLVPQIIIDQKVRLDQITSKFFNVLNQFAPFGPENMNPIFVAENLCIKNKPELLKDLHLKFFVRHKDSHITLEAIGFDMKQHYEKLSTCNTFKMAFTIEANNYKGHSFLQLNIKDIKFDD